MSHLGDKLLEGRATQTVIRFLFQAHDSSGLPPPRPELLGGSQEFKAYPGPSKGSSSLNIPHPATYITPLILSKKSQSPNTFAGMTHLVRNARGPFPLMWYLVDTQERRLSCRNERDGEGAVESRRIRMSDVQCSGVSALQNDSR